MDVALDSLDSLWPTYRGAALLGAARRSRGRLKNTGIAVTAGHVAITLDLHSAATAAAAMAAAGRRTGSRRGGDSAESPAAVRADDADDTVSPPLRRLTVLLDAVPASAPRPGIKSLARFLTKVLGGRNAPEEVVHGGGRGGIGRSHGEEGSLGSDIPEMLVVEHTDEVVCSEFVRFDYRRASGEGGTGGLAYASIEANGLLRLWEWGRTEGGEWSWSFLNSCNICACREDSVGCRVLTTAIVPEADNSTRRGRNRRHCLVWEQEDSGEGAGLGLASAPATGQRLPRRVWSRKITFDLSEVGSGGVNYDSAVERHHSIGGGGGGSGGGGGFGGGGSATAGARSEISLALSACLLPTGVIALLCSRLGAWMPTGSRVYFSSFATGRLPSVLIPSLLSGGRSSRGAGTAASDDDSEDGRYGRDVCDGRGGSESDATIQREGGLAEGSRGQAAVEHSEAFAPEPADGRESTKTSRSSDATRRLFAVHESTGDLMLYDHHPGATVRVLSLPRGSGGLRLRLQCKLDPPPPPPASPPGSFAVCGNLAVLCGSGACSVYDLCSGRLVGSTPIPACAACASGRRHRPTTDAAAAAAVEAAASSCDRPCSCGRRQRALKGDQVLPAGRARNATSAAAAAAAGPALWKSETQGHLVGVITATHVLRVRLPSVQACLTATLAPSSRRGNSSPPSAPTILRYVREYRRLVAGTAGGARPAYLLPELLRMVQQGTTSPEPHGSESKIGGTILELIGHTLAAEDRGYLAAATTAEATAADGVVRNHRNEAPVPPWLLMAMVSAAQIQGGDGATEVGGAERPPSFGGGDPATAAAQVGLRNALERRVAESLRSLGSVRTLLDDPAGSAARQGSAANGAGTAARSDVDEAAASRLAALIAAVDPTTALFESTLREWLACRSRGERGAESCGRGGGGRRPRPGGSAVAGGSVGTGLGPERAVVGGPRAVPQEVLGLAFRCEAAGDTEAMEIPFLRLLLEGSGESYPARMPTQSGGGGGGGGGGSGGSDREEKRNDSGAQLASLSSSASTFLCLQLAGDDSSPLFEIACRALFRLQPRKLPRFVERLARFRSYADVIKEGEARARAAGTPGDLSGDEEGGEGCGRGGEGGAGGDENQDTSWRRELQGTSVSSADSRVERTLGEDLALAKENQQQRRQHRSPSPPMQIGSSSRRCMSEGNAVADTSGRANMTVTSREHSPQRPSPAPAAPVLDIPLASGPAGDSPESFAAGDTSGEAAAASQTTPELGSRKRAQVSPAYYFARALASLPPAAEDDITGARARAGAGSGQRRARLSLLLGAGAYMEAFRLLRSRAWEGAYPSSTGGGRLGGWRGDRGAAEAWGAAMRLLEELSRAAASEREKREEAATATSGSHALDPASPPSLDGADETAAAAGAAATVAASSVPLVLQFRLVFEDALADTILADSPERMDAVMRCRPEGLTPVAVVRMVRRAAMVAATTAGTDAYETERSDHSLSGSTQTLKSCLLMLLEDGTGQAAAAAV